MPLTPDARISPKVIFTAVHAYRRSSLTKLTNPTTMVTKPIGKQNADEPPATTHRAPAMRDEIRQCRLVHGVTFRRFNSNSVRRASCPKFIVVVEAHDWFISPSVSVTTAEAPYLLVIEEEAQHKQRLL
jgi:hypothetical protein